MYSIEFVDGSIFIGGNPENSKWNEIPDKPIKELQYDYLGKEITLTNFEAYNHLVKYSYLIDSQQQVITAVIIMVLEFGRVKRIIFDLVQQQIVTDETEIGREYNNKPASGWKAGLIGLKNNFSIS